MTYTLDRWNMRELRNLYGHKEKAPAGKDQGEGETICGDEDSAELTPEQLAHDARIAGLHVEVIKHFEAGRRAAASDVFAQMCGLINARTPDHVTRLERMHGLLP